MDVEWTIHTQDDVTLVEVVVTNDGPTRRIRVSNELDGPVWPPRKRGVPAAGWDDSGYEGVVEDRCAIGYVTPAGASEPPVSVEWLEPITDESQSTHHPAVPTIERTPDGVYRALSDPTPPRDAIPVESATVVNEVGTVNRTPEIRTSERHAETEDARQSSQPRSKEIDHPTLSSLFTTIEHRIDDGTMLTEAETLPDAAWAVETVGGLTAVADLMAAIETDRETLRTVEQQAAYLRERAETVDVPVETLERLA